MTIPRLALLFLVPALSYVVPAVVAAEDVPGIDELQATVLDPETELALRVQAVEDLGIRWEDDPGKVSEVLWKLRLGVNLEPELSQPAFGVLLRNPVTAVRTWIDVLGEVENRGERFAHLDSGTTLAHRLTILIDDSVALRERMVPTYVRWIRDEDRDIRSVCAFTLCEHLPPTRSSVTAIHRMLREDGFQWSAMVPVAVRWLLEQELASERVKEDARAKLAKFELGVQLAQAIMSRERDTEDALALLEAGAPPDGRFAWVCGAYPAIYLAAKRGDLRLVRALIDRGADVNATLTDKPHVNALDAAKAGGHEEIVRLLLEAGAEDVPFYPPLLPERESGGEDDHEEGSAGDG